MGDKKKRERRERKRKEGMKGENEREEGSKGTREGGREVKLQFLIYLFLIQLSNFILQCTRLDGSPQVQGSPTHGSGQVGPPPV